MEITRAHARRDHCARVILSALAVGAAVIALPGPVHAAGGVATPEATPLPAIGRRPQDIRATELIGLKAVDERGQPLGQVEDVILAKAGGVHYAVLSFNAGLGLDDKLYTYPVSGLALGPTRGEIVVEAERSDLLKYAGSRMLPLYLRLFDPNAIVPDPPFVRASKLLGSAVHEADGSSVQVENVVLNLASGRLRFVVADMDGRRFALPRSAISL